MQTTICRSDSVGTNIVRAFQFRRPMLIFIDVAVSLRAPARLDKIFCTERDFLNRADFYFTKIGCNRVPKYTYDSRSDTVGPIFFFFWEGGGGGGGGAAS